MARRPVALFESWRGRYADSPRAISERLAQRHPEVRRIWVTDATSPMPAGTEVVRRHTPAYFARLLSADFVVCNDIIGKHLVKGPRVTYLQTWHGTPLKTIGYDEAVPKYSGAAAHRKRMARDVAKWDHLISPGPECTRIFRTAFGFDGDIVETGYPRNDMLSSPDAEQVRARVRGALGIPDSARAVLYAPTWRDDSKNEQGAFEDPGGLDLDEWLDATDDSTYLLMRMHKVVATRTAGAAGGRVLDVSDHPEISELYLAADVLVSDYSSAVYDFAVTRKPIVLFAYDLDHYRTGLRHLYFDYESWAPGPIVTTTGELAAAVDDVTTGSGAARHSASYAEFVERFCPLEDGRASDRVIDAVFEPRLGG